MFISFGFDIEFTDRHTQLSVYFRPSKTSCEFHGFTDFQIFFFDLIPRSRSLSLSVQHILFSLSSLPISKEKFIITLNINKKKMFKSTDTTSMNLDEIVATGQLYKQGTTHKNWQLRKFC